MNSPDDSSVYEFGGFVLDPSQRSLLRSGIDSVSIGPKAFDALVYLVEHAGQVVDRSELVSALWPRTVVEDNNLSQTILALRRALGDAEGGQRFVVTVPRRGCQFVADVTRRARVRNGVEDRPSASLIAPLSEASQRVRKVRSRRWAAGFLIAVLVLVTTLGFLIKPNRTAPASGPSAQVTAVRSIAVLPFKNLSPNPQDAYFAAGMHEEVLARLAKLRDVTVIARTSVMQYANDDAQSITSIAAALEVATVMEGSVRYATDRVRVTVRLVEGASGREMWSETYEAPLHDVFNIQSDIAAQIAVALESELTPAERTDLAARPTESMPAYASYLKALVLYRTSGAIGVSMPAQVRQTVRDHLSEAIALDPKFAVALGWRAQLGADSLHFDSFAIGERNARIEDLIAAVNRDATEALAVDPSLGVAFAALSRQHTFRYRLNDSLAILKKGESLAPNDTVVWQAAAVLHCIRNDLNAAIAAARRAIDLDPRNPGPYSLLAIALRASEKHDEAVAAFERMIELAPTAVIGYVGLARTLTAKGDTPRLRETLKVAEQFLGRVRNFRVDLALSYASIGEHADARRLIAEFRASMQGQYIDPGLEAMALLALGEHERAHEVIRGAIDAGRGGMDQLPLVLIRNNSWSDPKLESPEWRAVREELSYRGE